MSVQHQWQNSDEILLIEKYFHNNNTPLEQQSPLMQPLKQTEYQALATVS